MRHLLLLTTLAAGSLRAQSGSTVLFRSDWSTEAGAGSNALLDGGKWTSRWGGPPILAVVHAAGLGFPAGLTNVLRVTHGTGSFDWVQADGRWTVPALGESRAFRIYFRNDIGNLAGGWSFTHPIESKGTDGSINGAFYAWHIGSNTDGTFPIAFADAAPNPRNYFTVTPFTQEDVGSLRKGATYRLEWKFTRTGVGLYTLDIRIFGPDGALRYDKGSIAAWGGQSLAANPGGIPVEDQFMTGLRVGLNGGFPADSPQFVYWGGFAVCSDWCGPYTAER
jgi:hypothetical protein